MRSIKIGLAPTRRSIFSAPDAIKFANLTRQRLTELGVEFVDITDINEEGLLYQESDRIKIREKFRAAGVDGGADRHAHGGGGSRSGAERFRRHGPAAGRPGRRNGAGRRRPVAGDAREEAPAEQAAQAAVMHPVHQRIET